MIPHTDAHQAPADIVNPYEGGMHHRELMKHLKALNKNINAPLPEHYPGYFPGKEHGVTCLWLGEPSAPGSRKVCAFTLGVIPQWTVKDKNGNLKQKGWRAIFARLIRARAVTRRDLERQFLVNLTRSETKGDGLCLHCARAGKRKKAVGADRLCNLHHRIQLICRKAAEDKKEQKWLSTLSPERKAKALTSSPVERVFLSTPSRTATSSSAALRQGRKSTSILTQDATG